MIDRARPGLLLIVIARRAEHALPWRQSGVIQPMDPEHVPVRDQFGMKRSNLAD